MDRSKWEKILINFQVFARGHLVRDEVRRAREDFEDIVKEIDGGLTHLQWRDAVIPTPHFTDTDGPFLRPSSAASKPPDPGQEANGSPHTPAAAAALKQGRERSHHLLSQKIEAERDDSQTKGQDRLSRDFPGSYAGGNGEGQRQRDQEGDKDGGMMESTDDSTTIWSSLEMEDRGPRQYCLAQEVPHTPEALHLHRNTLTMELVWLQQAIDSRKKYLSLKDRLTIS